MSDTPDFDDSSPFGDDDDDFSAAPIPTGEKAHEYGEGDAPANKEIVGSIQAAPVYRDGISSALTYLIMAVKKNEDMYNCICQGNDKIKFYPNAEFFGITNEDLEACGINPHETRTHHGYVRYMGSRRTAAKLLTHVAATRGTITISPNMLLEAPNTGKGTGPRRKDKGGQGLHGYPSGPQGED
jgi:hypothetical protein